MESENYKHSELTKEIIKVFYSVYNYLGSGFLEKNYENAMCIELNRQGFNTAKQVPVKVYYKEYLVGNYFADLLVEDKVIIEVKASENIDYAHECQLTNYLKATDKEVGLLLNFGPQPQFKRKVFSNDRKVFIQK